MVAADVVADHDDAQRPAIGAPTLILPFICALLVLAPAALAAGPTPRVARYRVAEGSTIDLGWTGIAHGQEWPPEQRLEFAVACRADGAPDVDADASHAARSPAGGDCDVGGGSAGTIFGAPVPLASGGVPVCVVNTLREPLAGHVRPTSGCGELRLALESRVHTGATLAHPCPICVADRTPNDGRREGRCDGGPSAGRACDAASASRLFGATSNDCPPPHESGIGTLAIDVALTTGAVRRTADVPCAHRRPGLDDHCFCAGQPQPNACDSGTCGDERCELPVDGVCSRAAYRGCVLGTDERDCNDTAPGSGTCELRTRRCFGNEITITGTCDRVRPTYVAIFCAPATQAPAVNTTAGLPGPARLRLVLEAVATGARPPASTRRRPMQRRGAASAPGSRIRRASTDHDCRAASN